MPGFIALSATVFISFPFWGKQLFDWEYQTSEPNTSVLEPPCVLGIWVCVFWRTPWAPGAPWMCLHLTQDSWGGNGTWLCFDAEEFYFSFVRSLHPPLKAKQSPAAWVNIVTGSTRVAVVLFPFPTIAQWPRVAPWGSMVGMLIFER